MRERLQKNEKGHLIVQERSPTWFATRAPRSGTVANSRSRRQERIPHFMTVEAATLIIRALPAMRGAAA